MTYEPDERRDPMNELNRWVDAKDGRRYEIERDVNRNFTVVLMELQGLIGCFTHFDFNVALRESLVGKIELGTGDVSEDTNPVIVQS